LNKNICVNHLFLCGFVLLILICRKCLSLEKNIKYEVSEMQLENKKHWRRKLGYSHFISEWKKTLWNKAIVGETWTKLSKIRRKKTERNKESEEIEKEKNGLKEKKKC